MATIKEDIAVIKNMIQGLTEDMTEVKQYGTSITALKVEQASLKTKLTLFSAFQVGFSTAIGAVASYLGVKR